MTQASYKDSSALALRLRLYSGAVDWHGPTVFANGSAGRDDLRVDASIIGSSHVMEVRGRALALTELLACEAPSRGRPVALWKPGDPVVEYRGIRDARYRFEASLVDWNRSGEQLDFLRYLIDHATGSSSELGLSYRFPDAFDGDRAAETLVWAAATDGGVLARTAHSYPSEALVVLSVTTIQLVETVPVDSRYAVLAAA